LGAKHKFRRGFVQLLPLLQLMMVLLTTKLLLQLIACNLM
jgi:hypothetical protein